MRKPWQQSLQTLEWAQTGLQRERRERALGCVRQLRGGVHVEQRIERACAQSLPLVSRRSA